MGGEGEVGVGCGYCVRLGGFGVDPCAFSWNPLGSLSLIVLGSFQECVTHVWLLLVPICCGKSDYGYTSVVRIVVYCR